jgi:hypothetical protein
VVAQIAVPDAAVALDCIVAQEVVVAELEQTVAQEVDYIEVVALAAD